MEYIVYVTHGITPAQVPIIYFRIGEGEKAACLPGGIDGGGIALEYQTKKGKAAIPLEQAVEEAMQKVKAVLGQEDSFSVAIGPAPFEIAKVCKEHRTSELAQALQKYSRGQEQ